MLPLRRRFALGHGVGERDGYKPMFLVHEFSSCGTQTRMPSRVLRRTIHTMSYIERALYLYHEQRGFVDYWDGYPADRDITVAAAKAWGIHHPRYPRSQLEKFLTLDAVVTHEVHGAPVRSGWDAKQEEDLQDPEVQQELALHKAFCSHMGWSHTVFTWATVGTSFINNLDLLRGALPKNGERPADLASLETHKARMLEELARNTVHASIVDFSCDYEDRHRLPLGMGLRVFYNLAWEGSVVASLDVERYELQQVPALGFSK
jgi:hypothetical protein